jgi:hypothetical protein
MGDEHAHTGEVVVLERSPQTLVEATDTVVGIRGTLAVGYAVEEVAVVSPLLPHPLHFSRAWLEVAKVLLAYPRLFVDGDLVAGKRRGRGVVWSQRAEDAFGGLACAAVGRRIELERVVGLEEGTKLASCLFRL